MNNIQPVKRSSRVSEETADLNLLWKTPNVSLSPDFRLLTVSPDRRSSFTKVPYFELSFTVRDWGNNHSYIMYR